MAPDSRLPAAAAVACLLGLSRSGAAPAAAAELPLHARYVLCSQPAGVSARGLGLAGDLKVYAASISSGEGPDRDPRGRTRAPLSLRAAVFLDNAAAWETELPTVGDGTNANDGHAKGSSYAKCLGPELPHPLRVFSAVRSGAANSSLASGVGALERGSPCTISRFRNAELRQQFLHCALGGNFAKRWGRQPGPPARLRMDIAFFLVDGAREDEATRSVERSTPAALLGLELCRVERPLAKVSFCSQPLFGLASLRRHLPFVLDDWLDYHLDLVGFEHAAIYDVDGSFREALGPEWRRRLHPPGLAHAGDPSGKGAGITYYGNFPAMLSETLAERTRQHPYCAEMFAYSHCLTTQRALSRWVMLLHAPDEYVFVKTRSGRGGSLQAALSIIQRDLPWDTPVGMALVMAASFARGNSSGDVRSSRSGDIVATSRFRSLSYYWHTPLLDPATCTCAGAHTCYAEANAVYRSLMIMVDTALMVVHHYVEMLDRHRGRCAGQHKACDVHDTSAAWLVPVFRGARRAVAA